MDNYTSVTPRDTLKPEEYPYVEAWKIFVLIILLTTLIIAVILGNALVILTVAVDKSLQTVPNIFITSLAVADLLVGLLVLPLGIVYLVLGGKWNFGDILCHFWLTSDVTLCTVSILHLCVIGIDRYRTITVGVSYIQQRSLQGAFATIILIWSVALWISSPSVLGWNDWGLDKRHEESMECLLNSEHGYVIHSALGSLIFPLIVLIIVYYKIYLELQKRFAEKCKMRVLDAKVSNDGGDETEISEIQETPNANSLSVQVVQVQPKKKHSATIQKIMDDKMRFSLTQERRAAKVLGLIMGSFILCWLPFGFIYMLTPFLPYDYKPSFTIFQLTTWLGYFNSGINPVIYSGFSVEFRQGFRKVLSRIRIRNRSANAIIVG